jgi:hypothetical protein
MVYDEGIPGHPVDVGVMVITAFMGAVVVFAAVNEGI